MPNEGQNILVKLATVTELAGVLLQKEIEFLWSHEQDNAAEEIKIVLIITKNGGPILRFFNAQKPTGKYQL